MAREVERRRLEHRPVVEKVGDTVGSRGSRWGQNPEPVFRSKDWLRLGGVGGGAEKQHLDTVTGGKEAQRQVNGPG